METSCGKGPGNKKSDAQQIGRDAENFAADTLREARYKILGQNLRYRLGELDIVALAPDSSLVFVEVRYRQQKGFGSAEESVTAAKRMRIVRAAKLWLQRNPSFSQYQCRFDLIAFNGGLDSGHWLRGAFDLTR